MGVVKGFHSAVSFKYTDVHIHLYALFLDFGQDHLGGLSGLEA